MANWAERTYVERWNYSWGSATPGNVGSLGLIFSYVGKGPIITEDMLSISNNTGSISTIPDIPGLGVYMPGHVGVYVGNGIVIEARNEEQGIVKTNISSSPWSKWFEIPGVEYNK